MEGFLNPTETLRQLKLRENMIAADFGCGSGGWVLPLARKLKEGKVYGIDLLEEPISALKVRANSENLFNIETILADVEESLSLRDNSIDLVLMTNLLFEVEDKKKVFLEAKRVLKPKGEILTVDWLPDAPLGPKQGRISSEEIKKIAEEAGLKLKKEFEAGAYHYGLIFETP